MLVRVPAQACAALACAFALIADESKREFHTAKLAVHEVVCAERRKQANERLGRIEIVLAAVVLLLVGEGSVVTVLRRLIGG